MPVIGTPLETASTEFKHNATSMQSAIDCVRDIENKVEDAAKGAKARFSKKNILLPRERLELLLDPGSPFLELSSLAGYMMYDDKDGTSAGAGSICGIGYVSGIRCMVVVDNFAVKGGTVTPIGLKKKLRSQEIAEQNKLPVVTLAQSGGANLTYAPELFVDGGRAFANQARLSALGIPQVTIVHGSATAGGAYQPGLSDYVIMVRQQATTYLAGPPLLKAATGEVATDEALGGAEMHTQVSGVGDFLADNDVDGIRIARDIMAHLPWQTASFQCDFNEPIYDIDELIGLIPADTKKPYDCREIIARLLDGSDFLEFKSEYDQQTICGFGAIEANKCGVIANNGPITHKGAAKAGQFIQLCEQSSIPIVFLHNTTGFLVGTDSEHNGIIKHGSKMIQAVANAKTPKLSINVGGSYGAGNYAMCGRGFSPHFLFSWPNSRTSVMGGPQAGMVLRMVAESKMRKAGEVDEAKLNALEKQTCDMLEAQTTAIASTARLEDDGLIEPADTRKTLGFLLSICIEGESRETKSNTFGVSRF